MAMEEENKVQQDKLLEVSVATDLQRVNKVDENHYRVICVLCRLMTQHTGTTGGISCQISRSK